jgi:DNA-binding YbaB/EbfC family protein
MFGKLGEMKKKANEMKERLAEARHEGESSGIKVVCDGTKNVNFIHIPDLYLEPARKEELEEKLKEALNEAGAKADKVMKEEMSSLAGPLSGMLGL